MNAGAGRLKVPQQLVDLDGSVTICGKDLAACVPDLTTAVEVVLNKGSPSSDADFLGQQAWWTLKQPQAVSDARNSARLLCIKNSFQSAWLSVCPCSKLNLQLLPSEFVVLLRWWLGEPLFPPDEMRSCPLCGVTEDAFGDHVLCYRKAGIYVRHNAVVEFIVRTANAAGLRCSREVSIGAERPADVMIANWKAGKPLAVDVTIVHPLAPSTSFSSITTDQVKAVDAEIIKLVRYEEICEKAGCGFFQLALTTFGAIGPASSAFLFDLEQFYVADATLRKDLRCGFSSGNSSRWC